MEGFIETGELCYIFGISQYCRYVHVEITLRVSDSVVALLSEHNRESRGNGRTFRPEQYGGSSFTRKFKWNVNEWLFITFVDLLVSRCLSTSSGNVSVF